MKLQDFGTAPPHFYRELVRTAEGSQLLRQSSHFDEFVSVISASWSECEDTDGLLKLKGCLWAVGNIGSMELGAPFLEETDVVAWIVKIAEHSEVMTLRGTAFFVLGLISRSLHGMEIIAEHGWTSATDRYGHSLGYCLPPQLGSLFSVRLCSIDFQTESLLEANDSADQIRQEIFKKASRNLQCWKPPTSRCK